MKSLMIHFLWVVLFTLPLIGQQNSISEVTGATVPPPREGSPGVISGDYFFLMGGADYATGDTHLLNDVWAFDLEYNHWYEYISVDPADASSNHFCFSLGNNVFTHGGVSTDPDNYHRSLTVWDVQSGNHTKVDAQNPPNNVAYHAGTVIGNYAYTAGGENRYNSDGMQVSEVVGDVFRFDASQQTWDYLSTMGNIPKRKRHSVLNYNGDLYTFFGENENGIFQSLVSKLDLSNLQWSEISTTGTPTPRVDQGMVKVGTNKAYILGGSISGSGPTKEVWAFNFETNEYTQKEDLPVPLSGSSVWSREVEGATEIYLFGGLSTESVVNDFYKIVVKESGSEERYEYDKESVGWKPLETNPVLTLSKINIDYDWRCPDCTDCSDEEVPIMEVTLSVNEIDSWLANSITFQSSGTGNEQNDIQKVILKHGPAKLSEGNYNSDNGNITLSINLPIPAGNSITLSLYYVFEDKLNHLIPYGETTTYYTTTSVSLVNTEPDNYDEYEKLPPAPITAGPYVIGRVHNKNTDKVFGKIQDAINDSETDHGQTIEVCPGNYTESVIVTKQLTIESKETAENTIINSVSADQPVFSLQSNSAKIDDFTLQGSTNHAAVEISGAFYSNQITNCTIQSSSTGVYAENSFNTIIKDNKLDYLEDTGVFLDNVKRFELSGNTMLLDGSDDAVIIQNCLNTSNSDTSYLNNNSFPFCINGIKIDNSSNLSFFKNTLQFSEEYGVSISNSNGLKFQKNTFIESTISLSFNNCSNVIARENNIYAKHDTSSIPQGLELTGLRIKDSQNLDFRSNSYYYDFRDHPSIAIMMDNSSNCVFEDEQSPMNIKIMNESRNNRFTDFILSEMHPPETGETNFYPGDIEITLNSSHDNVVEGFSPRIILRGFENSDRNVFTVDTVLIPPVLKNSSNNEFNACFFWGYGFTKDIKLIESNGTIFNNSKSYISVKLSSSDSCRIINNQEGLKVVGENCSYTTIENNKYNSIVVRGNYNTVKNNERYSNEESSKIVLSGNHNRIENNTAGDAQEGCIAGNGNDVVIINNVIRNYFRNSDYGLGFNGKRIIISGNVIDNIYGFPGSIWGHYGLEGEMIDCTISSNTITNSDDGIHLSHSIGVTISNNNINNNKSCGIYLLDDSQNCLVQQNNISSNKGGIFLYNTEKLYVTGNTVNYNDCYGIRDESGRGNKIINNSCWFNRNTCSNTGIAIDGSDTFVSGNNIQNDESNGISVKNGASPQIRCNFISNNNGDGILVTDNSSPEIKGNRIEGNLNSDLNNENADVIIDASGNWWGNASGPENGSVSGNVDIADWLTKANDVVCSPISDTLYVYPGTTDSLIISINNFENPGDNILLTITADSADWLVSPSAINIALSDSVGSDTTLLFAVPEGIPTGTISPVIINTTSQTNTSQTATDTFYVASLQFSVEEIQIIPDSLLIRANDSKVITVIGYDSMGQTTEVNAEWESTGGVIINDNYIAGNNTGYFTLTASYNTDNVSDQIQVHIFPELDSLVVVPSEITVNPNSSYQFVSSGFNGLGEEVELYTTWSSGGGEITRDGLYTAGSDTGTFYVSVKDTISNKTFSAVVHVSTSTDILEEVIPEEYTLSQNYPNPFNPSTKIEYTLPESANVKVSIYDILGRQIDVLLNSQKTTGRYTLNWNAAKFASGIYFCEIKANGENNSFRKIIKMLFIK